MIKIKKSFLTEDFLYFYLFDSECQPLFVLYSRVSEMDDDALNDEIALLESFYSACNEKVRVLARLPNPIVTVHFNAGSFTLQIVFELPPGVNFTNQY